MRLTPDKACIRQLALTMPLQEIDLGDVQRFAWAAVARNNVDSQIVPGGRSARGHYPSAVIGKNDVWLRNELHLRKTPSEEIGISPVTGRRFAIEQAGRCQQYRARACRIDRIACPIPFAKPFLQVWVTVLQVVIGSEPKLRNHDDLGVGLFVDGHFRAYRNAVPTPERVARERDDSRSD